MANNAFASLPGLYIFDNQEQAERFLAELHSKANEIYTSPLIARMDEAVFTSPKTANNRQGKNKKKWVGLRMEQRDDPKVYVHLTERIIEVGDSEEADLSYLKLYVFRKSWYYSEYRGTSWDYVPNASPGEAPAGKYYRSLAINWVPGLVPAKDGIQALDLVSE